MVTQRSFSAPDVQPAIAASLHRQTAVGWRGLGPRYEGKHTRRAPFRARRVYNSSICSQSINVLGLDNSFGKQKTNTKIGRLERTRHVAARPEAASVGSNAWTLRPAQRTRRVSSRRQTTTTTTVGLAVGSSLRT